MLSCQPLSDRKEASAVPSRESDGRRQRAVRAWLESGAAFAGEKPEIIATHGNLLFLIAARAFKMKRAIDFGWMDFSTLAKREAACRQELALNRRTAPEIYLAVHAVTEEAGGFALDGGGRPAEWLVEMRRFDEAQRLDHLSDRGALTRRHISDLADAIAAFHAAAEPAAPRDFATVLEQVARENQADMAKAAGLFPEGPRRALEAEGLKAAERHRGLIAERVAQGWLRRCHGDLHLANIVLWKGRPTPFDCIEFNEDYIAIDLLYDLAFLLMDLEQRGRRDLANLVLNRWLAMAPEPETQLRGLALLPLLLSLRSGIRAKISGLQWLEAEGKARERLAEEGRRYLERASAYLEPAPAVLVGVGGLSGSGKSTLAASLALDLGAAPGAVLLRSDVLRKRLYGVAPEERLPQEAYAEGWNRRVIETLLTHTSRALEAGRSVILDAVSADPALRGPLQALAKDRGLPFAGLWLEAPLEVLKARVGERRGDASDATEAVVERQARSIHPPDDWHRVPAGGSRGTTLAAAQSVLGSFLGR